MPLPRAIRLMVFLLLLALVASGMLTTPAHGSLILGPHDHHHTTGAVTFADSLLLQGNWGHPGLGDLNQDGTVDFSDQLILTGAYTSALPRGLGLSTDGNVIGFTGHVFDAETGLLLARLRVHDAVVLGRWLSRDPAGFVDGMNLYVYVRGNPLAWWDPLGMWIFRWLGLATDQSAAGATTTGWDVADAYVTGFVKGIGEAAANTKAGIEGGLKTVIIGGSVTLGLVDERHLEEVPIAAAMMDRVMEGNEGSLLGDFARISTVEPLAAMRDGILSGDPEAAGAALRGFGLFILTRQCVRGRTGRMVDDGVDAARGVRYGPLNRGPLPDGVANTFRGGSYTGTTVSEPTMLYRVHGGTAGEVGQFWTRTPPAGPLQSQIDLALNPAWGNTATQVTTIRVPAGTTIFEGFAAGQGGLVGGGSQVVIPSVNPAWIVR